MKKLALVIIFTMLAGSALAQSWGQNNIGVYLDPNGAENCGFGSGDLTLYLVGTGLQTATVGGWEAKISIEGPAYGPMDVSYPVDGLNLAQRVDEWVVGFGQPAPAPNGTCVFMTFHVFVTDALVPTEFFISPLYFSSLPGTCAYLDGSDYEIKLPLYNSTGDPLNPDVNLPVATLNGECVVPSEDASWGGVKSLYR